MTELAAIDRLRRSTPPPVADAGGLESAAGTPASESRFPCLDGYRAIAAFAVILVHVGFQTGRSLNGNGYSILARGDIGVPVFFVLSGFLLYRPMAYARLSGRPLPSLRDYFVKRVLRIVPAYWVSVVLAMLLISSNSAARHSVVEWARYLTFTQIYSYSSKTVGLEQDWSLCVEATFYVTLPLWPRLLSRLTRRSGRPSAMADLYGAIILLVIAVAWMLDDHGVHHALPFLVSNWLPEYLGWFAGGMLLAVLSILPRTHPGLAGRLQGIYDIAESPMTCLLLAGAVYALVLTPAAGPYDLSLISKWQIFGKEILYGVFAVLFLLPGCLGDQRRGALRHTLASFPFRKLGEASYGVFLFHMPVLYLIFQYKHYTFPSGHFALVLWLDIPITVVLAVVSLYLVERPALRLKSRFARRRQLTPVEPQLSPSS